MEKTTTNTKSLRFVRIQADLILLLVAAIWGSGFVAQRIAAQNFGVFLFNGSRFLLGALLLLPFVQFRLNVERKLLPWVILAGLFLFGGSALQQAGLQSTTAGNAGFITGTYVVLVPVLLVIFFRQKIGWNSWLAAFLALAGTLFLSTGGSYQMASGDILELAGAFLWAMHVILVGRLANKLNVLQFAIGQYIVCGMLNLLLGIALEWHTISGMTNTWWTILYSGIFPVAIGFTLQAVGQKNAPASDAAIILGMEAVFAALFGFLFLTERLTPVQLFGSVLIMAGIILTQAKKQQRHET